MIIDVNWRPAHALALGVLVTATAACGADSDRLAANQPSPAATAAADARDPSAYADLPVLPAPVVGQISRGQSKRSGADGTTDCGQDAVLSFAQQYAAPDQPVRVFAGYLTDADGLLAWSTEMNGLHVLGERPPAPEQLHALCWLQGQFSIPNDDATLPAYSAKMMLLNVQLAPSFSVSLMQASERPPAVLAPATPARVPQGAKTQRPQKTHGQPEGVTYVD
jgi:hypothetical protein